MVFYFSGTGNSQLAAKQISSELGDELVSINECLKSGEKGVPFGTPVGICRAHLRLACAEGGGAVDR
ncbi:MAG: hypothetical protein ACLSAP_01960 [Oscillospiraceae bacterium]